MHRVAIFSPLLSNINCLPNLNFVFYLTIEANLKEKNKQQPSSDWGHKVLRIVNDDNLLNSMIPATGKESIDHIKMDDLQYEYEALNMDGWRYQMGFALDDDSFYLFYKKPLDSKK